ncbi:MAG: heme exporter protein CcmD [Pseudomonadota bacterium]
MSAADWYLTLTGVFGDKYGVHVVACYVITLLGLGLLALIVVSANARARRELETLDQERSR